MNLDEKLWERIRKQAYSRMKADCSREGFRNSVREIISASLTRISHGLAQRGGGDALRHSSSYAGPAGLTRHATANANEDPAVVLVQYVEEAVLC